ncbi:unnamed protein product [Ascophyllum nodosum]
MNLWIKLSSASSVESKQGRLPGVGINRRSRAVGAAVALLPGAMSLLLRAGPGCLSLFPRASRGGCCAAAQQGCHTSPMGGGITYSRRLPSARGWRRRGLAMVGGGGDVGGKTGGGRDGWGDSPPATYNFAKRATRFKAWFEDADAVQEGVSGSKAAPVPITVLPDKAVFAEWLGSRPLLARSWIKSLGHDSHKPGRVILVPSAAASSAAGEGEEQGLVSLAEVAFCLGEGGEDSAASPFSLCSLRDQLPAGVYALRGASGGPLAEPNAAALSWALGGYSFDRYKGGAGESGESGSAAERSGERDPGSEPSASESKDKVLAWPEGADRDGVAAAAASIFLVRDLISTPCEHMGPQHLEAVMMSLAEEFGANVAVTTGDDLLKEGDDYPQIHAVGRAAGVGREPRLLDLTWTPPTSDGNLPKVTLVGKGVCFDTGGLDIKPASGMLIMKKDMGGGAEVIGLARMIMSQELPVRLRVLVPAVENAISGGAFRPGDVIVARNGKTTEIGNTDAEGRLVLADALVEASLEYPDLIIDCATLTGAARVALGTDVPVVFCNDDDVAAKLHALSGGVSDQVWRLPLWADYRKQLSSKIADLKNIGNGGYGGAITAALYLEEFVGKKSVSSRGDGGGAESGAALDDGAGKLRWIHMDFMAYNQASRPGRPEGGEAQGMRALYALIEDMFGAERDGS